MGKYGSVGSLFDRIFRNTVNDALVDIDTDIQSATTTANTASTNATSALTAANTALTTANEAKTAADDTLTTAQDAQTKAEAAVSTANDAKSTADTTKGQLDQITAASSIDPQVSQALVGADGKTYTNLANRFDSNETQLAEITQNTQLSGEVGIINKKYPVGDIRRYGATGDGTTDDTQALLNAITSSNYVYIPNPTSKYRITSTLSLTRDGIVVVFESQFSSKLYKDFDGELFTISGGECVLEKPCIDGNGANHTGGAIRVSTNAADNLKIIKPRILNTQDSSIVLESNAGTYMVADSGMLQPTSTTTPAIRITSADNAPQHRHFNDIDTGGTIFANLDGMETTMIIGCSAQNITYGANAKKAMVVGSRFTTIGNPLIINGIDHTFVGNAVAGNIELETGSKNCQIGLNALAGNMVVRALRTDNDIFQRGFQQSGVVTGVRQTLLPWSLSNIQAAGTTGAVMTGNAFFTIRSEFSVVGIGVKNLSGTITAGTLSVELYKNNVATGLKATLSTLALNFATTTAIPNTYNFSASDKLDLRVTTSIDFVSSSPMSILATFEIES